MRKKLGINKENSEDLTKTDNTVFESENEKKEYEDLGSSENTSEESESDFDNVLEQIQETSKELTEVIEEYLEDSTISDLEQNFIDLNIPYCKKCKLQFTVDLWGNPQCEKQLADCPTISS